MSRLAKLYLEGEDEIKLFRMQQSEVRFTVFLTKLYERAEELQGEIDTNQV